MQEEEVKGIQIEKENKAKKAPYSLTILLLCRKFPSLLRTEISKITGYKIKMF